MVAGWDYMLFLKRRYDNFGHKRNGPNQFASFEGQMHQDGSEVCQRHTIPVTPPPAPQALGVEQIG